MITVNRVTKREFEVTAPPSKAHTLRALMLGSLACGTSRIIDPLLGQDQLHLIACLCGLGIEITQKGNMITITGAGGRFKPTETTLDCSESGIAMNFLIAAGCLAGQPIVLSGEAGLLTRPVREIVEGMRSLGCEIAYLGKEGFPPVKLSGQGVGGGTITMSGAKTSQYFSSAAITAPYAAHPVRLVCRDEMTEKPYFDITLDMMARFGLDIPEKNYRDLSFPAGRTYSGQTLTIEGDYSSASYYFSAAAITGSTITIKGLNPTSCQGDRKIIDYLSLMGCHIVTSPEKITISGGQLVPLEQDMSDTPDIVPTIAVTAAFAEGKSQLRNIGHLQYKECDRITALQNELAKMQIRTEFEAGNLIIRGNPRAVRGAAIETYNDHRIAMSFAVAGLNTGDLSITDTRCVEKSFPDFWQRFAVFQ